MQYRRFGTTGLTVSEVGFGCARLGGFFQGTNKVDMVNTLHAAFDRGITFFDTADMYCQGESEQLLGEAFRHKRDRVIIASKAGYCLPAQRKIASKVKPLLKPLIQRIGLKRQYLPSNIRGSLSQDFSAGYLLKAVEQSLRRLKTDYLDLYQLHSPPTAILERGEFLEPLERLKGQGKIRYYGISCETTEDALICLRYPGISALQIRLSLLDQSALQKAVPDARDKGVALIARECFAGGLLAKPADAVNLQEIIPDEAEREKKRQEIMEHHGIAERKGQSLTQMALEFVHGTSGISVTLLGMRTMEHLEANMHLIESARDVVAAQLKAYNTPIPQTPRRELGF
jgi:aryl-alcohol dehydrogenase-like predicted oxidoreductase